MSSSGVNHYTPVILSPVVLDQCKSLLVDSLVRRMFLSALNTTALQTDAAIKAMNDKDREMAQDLAGAAVGTLLLAASLATKEARNDRHGAAFWNSCKWARKLTKRVAHLLSTTNDHGGGGTTGTKSSSSKNWPCRASQPRAVVCSTRLVLLRGLAAGNGTPKESAASGASCRRRRLFVRSDRNCFMLFVDCLASFWLVGAVVVKTILWGPNFPHSANRRPRTKRRTSPKHLRGPCSMCCAFQRPCCQPRGPFCNRIPKWRRI